MTKEQGKEENLDERYSRINESSCSFCKINWKNTEQWWRLFDEKLYLNGFWRYKSLSRCGDGKNRLLRLDSNIKRMLTTAERRLLPIRIKHKNVFFCKSNTFTDIKDCFCERRCTRPFCLVKIHHRILIIFYQPTLISGYIVKTKMSNCSAL